MAYRLLPCVCSFLALVGAMNVVDLSGDQWTIQNLLLNISLPASLPSHAHLDLYANQVIGNPLYGQNDYSLRWIAWNNWTYVSHPIDSLGNADSTWLVFNGLDTFTTIKFCGQFVANTDNQFRQYFFDVSSLLPSCPASDQTLSINFGSAPMIVDRIASQPGQEVWPSAVEIPFEFPNRQFMRKQQSDFGWDWGPAFAPAGPWQPAFVVQLNESDLYVRNMLVDAYRHSQVNNMIPDQNAPWVLNVSVDVIGLIPEDVSLRYELVSNHNSHLAFNGNLENITVVNGAISGFVSFNSTAMDLWWPSKMGPQNLYHLNVTVSSGDRSVVSSTRRIGFRTIVLNELPVTDEQIALGIAPGNNWHFEINGHPFYAKGSNFIPPDAFWPTVTPQRIRSLFDAVIQGNQNMLRVWSSGAYSPDFMYDIADEMGILLWSEFEFGDALYPVDRPFLENVYEEAVYQVRRVNHHPSLAYWAGGNELENLELPTAQNATPSNYSYYYEQYEELFLTTLFPAVFENSHGISYAPSSTSNGFISLNFTDAPYFDERLDNLEPGSIYGETDYYNYDTAVAFNFSKYPVGRFSNEFGFHSMPSLQSWESVLPRSQLSFNSTFIISRNHHNPPRSLDIFNHTLSLQGMGQMTSAVTSYYPPPNHTNPIANFSAWCHATQIFQADYYVSQINFYRRGSGLPQRTLGSLYWQLEDIWQAPSWAGIEYNGRWKVLHYAAKRAYEPLIIAPFFDEASGTLEIWVVSDLWEPVTATVNAAWFTWSGEGVTNDNGTRLESQLSDVTARVGALNATRLYTGNITRELFDAAIDPRDVVLKLSVSATGHLPNNDTQITFSHEAWFHPVPLSEAHLVDPGLSISHDTINHTFSIEATTGIGAWVWLDYPAGPQVVVFEDNGFWMQKGERRVLGYTVKDAVGFGSGGRGMCKDRDAWIEGVTVESIWNSTLP